MNHYSSSLIILLAALAVGLTSALGVDSNNTKPAQIGVYFESRCPDSARFFLNQLLPTYRKLGDTMQPILIPFGHARTLGQNKMLCQHGPRECDGNRLMACILARNATDSAVIETIGCIFNNNQTNKQCVEANLPGVSYDDLDRCKTSDESYQLMVKYEEMTGRLDYVPHLTYNNQSSEEIQSECEHNLKEYVCKNYAGTRPKSCD